MSGPRGGLWLRIIHAFIYAAAAYVGVLFMAPLPVVAAAAAAVATGALLAGTAAVARLRTQTLLAVALLGLLIGTGLRTLLSGSDALAELFGPAELLTLSYGAQAVLLGLCFSFSLRGLSRRYAWLRVVEVVLVGVACAQPVVGHRGGAINRPFKFSDMILSAGQDPTVWFMVLGALVAVLVLVLLVAELRPLRALAQVSLAVLLLSLLSTQAPLPQPSASPLLSPGQGKSDKPDQKHGGKGDESDQTRKDEELEFRDDYNSSGKQTPLAVVLLHDDYSPPSGMYYLRQAAFSQFNGRRLIMATRADVDRDVADTFASQATDLDGVAAHSADRIEVDTTVALLAEHTRPFALESLVGLSPVRNPDPGRFRRVYRATSAVLTSHFGDLLERDVFDQTWSKEVRDHYLQVPDDPRYHELAEQIVHSLPETLRGLPVARALSVSRWLGEKGIYSLKSKHADAEDPTADFLFGDLTGYCVHFAHAAVYLMRALGVPARVGAGYVIEEAARQGGSSLLLTGANAHAWPELYVAGVGWVVADVAPQQALDPPPPPPDPDLQRLLGEMARGLRPLPPSPDNTFKPVIHAAQQLLAALRWFVRVGLPSLLVLLYALKLWRRRLAPRLASGRKRARIAYRAQLGRLAELSLRRRYGESPEAFAHRVARQVPAFEALTGAHVAAAYRPEAPVVAWATVRAMSASIGLELSRVAPLWRRVLAWLDPVTFLFAR